MHNVMYIGPFVEGVEIRPHGQGVPGEHIAKGATLAVDDDLFVKLCDQPDNFVPADDAGLEFLDQFCRWVAGVKAEREVPVVVEPPRPVDPAGMEERVEAARRHRTLLDAAGTDAAPSEQPPATTAGDSATPASTAARRRPSSAPEVTS